MKEMNLSDEITDISKIKQVLDDALRKPEERQIVITTDRKNYNLIMKWLKEQEKIKNFTLC